tara:strand:+ start:1940 stop:2152 length:213 start_codon:yes stop_codon:yes gene_type:complete
LINRLIKLVDVMLGLLESYNPSVAAKMKEELDEIKHDREDDNLHSQALRSISEKVIQNIPGTQNNNIQDT